jgi:hypothetical protein
MLNFRWGLQYRRPVLHAKIVLRVVHRLRLVSYIVRAKVARELASCISLPEWIRSAFARRDFRSKILNIVTFARSWQQTVLCTTVHLRHGVVFPL